MIAGLLICICVLAVFFLIVMLIDGNRFVVRNYKIYSNKIDEKQKIVLISDLHNKNYGKDNDKVLDKIKEIRPDFILIAGDLVTARPKEKADVALTFARNVCDLCPVYYGMGNHEYRLQLYPEKYLITGYEDEIRKIGVTLLDNERVDAHEQINIAGLSIEKMYYKRFEKHSMEKAYVEKELGKCASDAFQILIAHNPEYFDAYADWGADLTVSGHLHGGIMRLPFLGGVISTRLTLFPRYDGGMFQKEDKTMIVSRGLGMHTLPIRIFNPGELVVIELLPDKAE